MKVSERPENNFSLIIQINDPKPESFFEEKEKLLNLTFKTACVIHIFLGIRQNLGFNPLMKKLLM